MKKLVSILCALTIAVSITACQGNQADIGRVNELEAKIAEMEDKAEIEALIDSFSILADQKDAQTQAQLFTEDAVVTIVNGDRTMELNGREEIGTTFGNTLASFGIVYHLNGQKQIEVNGDTATGIAYCQAVLARNVNGDGTDISHEGVWYEDEYVKVDGKWLISSRKSTFTWVQGGELPQE